MDHFDLKRALEPTTKEIGRLGDGLFAIANAMSAERYQPRREDPDEPFNTISSALQFDMHRIHTDDLVAISNYVAGELRRRMEKRP